MKEERMFNRDMVAVEPNHARNGRCGTNPSRALRLERAEGRYYAEVPALTLDEQSLLIEQLIGLAFDALGARHLEVRVRGAEQAGCRVPEANLRPWRT